ncbi:hypothetical protein M153_17280002284 [Pseudoloma neurophilia]|uniref:SKP1 component POZ domain-containing protein n=1 Tax=Pseudoloma neurophilia TaxID=146866 RepID=A0A0R0LUH5_9MICR|nr:hypothetical protein M153_17280002284 [Pseudoloma neurophilia]
MLQPESLLIQSKDGHQYKLSNNLISRSVLLSQLIEYPVCSSVDNSSSVDDFLPIPFNLEIIKLAESFSSIDTLTKIENIGLYDTSLYKPMNIKHVFIPDVLLTFFDNLTIEQLTELINLSNYLNYNLLLECLCNKLAKILNGTAAEEVVWT